MIIGGVLVTKSCPTLVIPCIVVHKAPLSLGFFQAKILEWAAISFSRGSSQPRNWTWVFCIQADSLPSELIEKPQKYDYWVYHKYLYINKMYNIE